MQAPTRGSAHHCAVRGPSPQRHRARPSWADLPARARAWRIVHAAWSVAQLASLAYLWRSAVTRRRGTRPWAVIAFLLAEGAALIVGRGSCPMGPRQAEWGDPVPFFELLLPPRAAKAAVPVLAVVTGLGIAAVFLNPPSAARRVRPR